MVSLNFPNFDHVLTYVNCGHTIIQILETWSFMIFPKWAQTWLLLLSPCYCSAYQVGIAVLDVGLFWYISLSIYLCHMSVVGMMNLTTHVFIHMIICRQCRLDLLFFVIIAPWILICSWLRWAQQQQQQHWWSGILSRYLVGSCELTVGNKLDHNQCAQIPSAKLT